jgi:hypothetical protein
MESNATRGTDAYYDQEETTSTLNTPLVALAAAAVVGVAIGAIVIGRRRTPQRFATVDRAIDLARSGAVNTYSSLKQRLKYEGYTPSEIEGRAKRYIGELLQTAADRLRA